MSLNPELLKAFESWSRSDLNLILLKKEEVSLNEAMKREKARLISEAKALFAAHDPTAPIRATIEAVLASKTARAPARAVKARAQPAQAQAQPAQATVEAVAVADDKLCLCLTQKGEQCSFKAVAGSRFCTRHSSCSRVMGEVSKEQVVEAVHKEKAAALKEIFGKHKATPLNEKKRMAKECPNCCSLIRDGVCKYPLCAESTCDRDCSRLKASRTAARMQKRHLSVGDRKAIEAAIQAQCTVSPQCDDKCPRVYAD